MEQTATQILSQIFGYDRFRPPQDTVIETLASGQDALVVMPTGGGKSLCYQIPALMRHGVGVIVSPLIALMHDQVNALRQLGVRAAYINSASMPEDRARVKTAVQQGQLDLLYLAPERLLQEQTLDLLSRCQLALIAIDEAHCVSQWGHDFRPEYLRLQTLRHRFPAVPRIALTATADEHTREDISRRLEMEQARHFICGFNRPNIRYRVTQTDGGTRTRLLRFIREEHAGECGIVYCLSRKRVDATAEWLNTQGFTALPYHAGLQTDIRKLHQDRFLREDGIIIVATIAFGMGIDKPDVRFVAHLNLPRSIEAYYQETGRAGRDGLAADAWMSYGLQDVITLRQMLESSEAADEHKRIERHKLDAVLGFCELTSCRRQALLRYFGDELELPCGNCDTCLEPVQTWDATTAAQKALSCVHRTGQRFGVNYLIDVLLAKENERIRRFGHHLQSTYGIGKELSASQWRGVFRQLISQGLLELDLEGYGGLRLSPACRPLLRGEKTLLLREEKRAEKKARRRKETTLVNETDRELWEALRDQRRKLATEQGVPPYVVFHDATLRAMIEQRPKDLNEMALVSGIGARKLDAYGQQFLGILLQHLGKDEPPTSQGLS